MERKRTWLPPRPTRWSCPCNNPIWPPFPRHAKRIWPLLRMMNCAAAGLDGRPWPWWPASLHGSFFVAHGAWHTLGNSPSICTCSDSWFPILHLVFHVEPLALWMPWTTVVGVIECAISNNDMACGALGPIVGPMPSLPANFIVCFNPITSCDDFDCHLHDKSLVKLWLCTCGVPVGEPGADFAVRRIDHDSRCWF